MTRGTARFTHAATLAAGITGLIYGWMRYVLTPEDEFALVNHPAEPLLKSLHIVLVPLLILAFGLLLQDHVWVKFRSGFRARRPTGLWLLALFAPMALSGYFLQISSGEFSRWLWIWVHVLTSVLWLGAYGIHHLRHRG